MAPEKEEDHSNIKDIDGIWECNVCLKNFVKKDQAVSHYRTHEAIEKVPTYSSSSPGKPLEHNIVVETLRNNDEKSKPNSENTYNENMDLNNETIDPTDNNEPFETDNKSQKNEGLTTT